jgi:hypothetical protein
VLLELALEDSKCTKVNVQRVFLEYMKPNAERDLWDYMEREPEEADKTIFESLEIANYLDLGPVISILCRCIARVINTMCADTAAIRERFQMQEQDSLFNRISPDFWQTHLFRELPSEKQDMMFASCGAFSPLNPKFRKLLKCLLQQLPNQLAEIDTLTGYMECAKVDAEDIAKKWIEEWCKAEDEDSVGTHLHHIIGKLLGKEADFDYEGTAYDDKKSKYRLNVIDKIIEWEEKCKEVIGSIKKGPKKERTESVKKTINMGAQEVISYLERCRVKDTTHLTNTTTVFLRVSLSYEDDEDDLSDDEIQDTARLLLSEFEVHQNNSGTTRGTKRQKKSLGGGGSGGASTKKTARVMLREAVRTFPEGCAWQLVISARISIPSNPDTPRDMQDEPLSNHHRVKDESEKFEYGCITAGTGHTHAVLVCTYKVSTEDQVMIYFQNFGSKSVEMTISSTSVSHSSPSSSSDSPASQVEKKKI